MLVIKEMLVIMNRKKPVLVNIEARIGKESIQLECDLMTLYKLEEKFAYEVEEKPNNIEDNVRVYNIKPLRDKDNFVNKRKLHSVMYDINKVYETTLENRIPNLTDYSGL